MDNQKEEAKPEATEEAKPEATEEAKPEATEEAKPEATEEAKPEATEEAKPEATEEAKPEATEEAKPEATEEAKPEATEEAKPEAESPELPTELSFDEFRPGDNITVNIKIIEGERQRIQSFQGDVIKGRYIKNSPPQITSTFMVRRIASGVGVERIFPYFSPVIDSIKLNRRGKVNQARIYYMRERSGKSARIKERRI